jgi:hypothetical protein
VAVSRKLDDRELIAQLLERLGGRGARFEPGRQVSGVIEADGMTLTIVGEIARKPAPVDLAAYRAGALAQLEARPGMLKCDVYTKGSGSIFSGRHSHRCGRAIVAGIVYSPSPWSAATRRAGDVDPSALYRFVCGTHRKDPDVDKAKILGVVELPRFLLRDAYAALARAEAESAKRHREEEEAEEQHARSVACPKCQAEPGAPCRWNDLMTTAPAHGARRELAGPQPRPAH